MQLRPYQLQIVDHICQHPRTNLFVPMGAGKTVSVLTALDMLSLTEDVFPVLVVAPLRVARSTWPDEIEKWAHLRHLRVSVITGPAHERNRAAARAADIYCINYDNLDWLDKLAQSFGNKWIFKTIVADEATRLKGFRTRQGAKRARALARYAHATPRYIGLTGTPASNGLVDLWALAWFVDKGQRLGLTYKAFIDRWFQTIGTAAGFNLVRPLAHAQREIEDRLKDICLSIDLSEHIDMREPIHNTISVELPAKARKIYRDMEREMFAEIRKGKDIAAFSAAAKTMKCLQLANGAVYTDEAGNWEDIHDAKLDALESIIEEASGAPVLVAYHFKSDLARLQKRFRRGRVLDADPKTIRDWNAGKIPVLFAHPASAGHGLNLQDGGNILAFFSLNWNLEERLQIIERIGPARQAQAGHDRPVFVHNIIAKDTIDELVLQRMDGKKEIVDLIMEATRK
jgi:SNF2 family DNA or RNA helicase